MTDHSTHLKRFGRHRALPVGLVTEHGPEVAHDVNNTEDETTRTEETELTLTQLVYHSVLT